MFRGKRIDNGKWVTGCLVSTSHDEAFILIGLTGHLKRDSYECYMVPVKPDSIGPLIGCKDCKGKEVFKDDIIKFFYDDKWRIEPVVMFSSAIVYLGRQCNFYAHMFFSATQPFMAEIIGNIHDNPNLLNPLKEGVLNMNSNFDPGTKAEEVKDDQAAINAAEDQANAVKEPDAEEGQAEG